MRLIRSKFPASNHVQVLLSMCRNQKNLVTTHFLLLKLSIIQKLFDGVYLRAMGNQQDQQIIHYCSVFSFHLWCHCCAPVPNKSKPSNNLCTSKYIFHVDQRNNFMLMKFSIKDFLKVPYHNPCAGIFFVLISDALWQRKQNIVNIHKVRQMYSHTQTSLINVRRMSFSQGNVKQILFR